MAGRLITYPGSKINMKDIDQQNIDVKSKQDIEIFLSSFSNIASNHYGKEIYDKWFKDLDIMILNDHEIIFKAPSKFVRDWVRREYIIPKALEFSKLVISIKDKIKKISIIHDDLNNKIKLNPNSNNKIVNLSKHDNVFSFGTDLNQRYTLIALLVVNITNLHYQWPKLPLVWIFKPISLMIKYLYLFTVVLKRARRILLNQLHGNLKKMIKAKELCIFQPKNSCITC